MTPSQHRDVLVIGAGIAGLMAANHLHTAGLHVTVVDKGRSVGGRLATRRMGTGKADHGAQFFTVREGAFAMFVADWQRRGLVEQWSRGWSAGSLVKNNADGFPRYRFNGGMNAMATTLAAGLPNVHVNNTIVKISASGDAWIVTNSAGDTYAAKALVLTAPVPQSLALLKAGDTPLDDSDRIALERVSYAPCLCGLILLDRPAALPDPGAIQRTGYWVPWIADNQAKGISDVPILTLHADDGYSRANYEASDEKILADLEPEWRAFAPDAVALDSQVKRWRYSRPTMLHPEPTLVAQGLPPLAFAGDGFGHPRVEGAAVSGIAAADALIALFNR